MLSTKLVCTGWENVSRLNVFSPLYFDSALQDPDFLGDLCPGHMQTAQVTCCLMQSRSGSQPAQISMLNHSFFFSLIDAF